MVVVVLKTGRRVLFNGANNVTDQESWVLIHDGVGKPPRAMFPRENIELIELKKDR